MRVFGEVDFVLTPVTSAPPPKFGFAGNDPLAQYLADIYTIPVNLAGLPGISVPCGVADGLPIGLHLIGKPLDESTLLAAANAFELGR
jgi:aspartyl-tRNA(Asn)/glutamyl-tRNA(Gln) amidotransferase subunit A